MIKIKSFKKELFGVFVIVGIIPLFLMGIFSYYNTSRIINKKINNSLMDNIDVMAKLLDYSLDNFQSIITYVSTNEDVINVLNKTEFKNYDERFDDSQKIYKITNTLLATQKMDIPIYISGINNKYIRFSTAEYFAPIYFDINNEIFKEIDKSEQKNYFFINRRVDGKLRKDVVLAIGTQIKNISDNKKLGYAVLDIYDEYFDDIFNQANVYKENNIYVLNKDGTIITDKLYKDRTGFKFYDEYLSTVLGKDSGTFNCKIKGNNYMAYFTTCKNTEIKIIEVVPTQVLFKDRTLIIGMVILSVIILGIIAIAASFLLSNSISKPINKLSRLMNEVENGNMNVNFDSEYDDEIGKLGYNFNKMIKEINRLIEEVYKKQYLLKESELKALKAQVNPHFLYNTLESINWMAKLGDAKGVSKMVTTLGKFLRYCISKRGDIVTVNEEIEQIKNYLTIQKVRYGDRFKVSFDVNNLMLEKHMPRLLLQPLVENAIIHGLEPKSSGGILIIKGYILNQNDMCFEIIDNGVGLTNSNSKGEGIGIQNVNDRIKLQYGDEYGAKVFSENKMTISKLVIPCNDSILETGDKYE
ncbi:sensor histidine kinase [Clostridium sp. JN-9]|uniref:sensor histidine kinase n=1 Tax=Clostridium sp. JN-9 TaxID=2507159 RepID=UPI000FFE0120|nr:sensor histidine kinase [Clostridium sp. JN-9]QAT38903.1 sensor histidine kinase [Clostridium sp. JN-9]